MGSRGLQAALATTPGWSTEDNGLLHVRGVDDGFLFVKDGVPIYERIDPTFGVSPEAATISSLNVITGHIPAEFGLKSGAVVEIRSQYRPGASLVGHVRWRPGGRSDEARSPPWARVVWARTPASCSTRTASARTASSTRSIPTTSTTRGSVKSAEAQLSWNPRPDDLLTLGLNHGRSHFDVPNIEEQEEAGQDQRQGITQTFALASWQRRWSSGTVSQLAMHGRFTEADLTPSEGDTPLSSQADRSQDRFGLLGSVTQQRGRHVLKGGFEVSRVSLRESFGFYVTDPEEAEEAGLGESAIAFTRDDPFAFQGSLASTQVALHAQDTWRPLSHLLVNLGLRFDRTRLAGSGEPVEPAGGRRLRVPRLAAPRFAPPPTGSSSRRSRRTCCSRRRKRRGPCRRSWTRREAVRPCGRRGRAPSRSG